MKKVSKILFISAGFVLMAVGAAGAVLPILPATPFLLAAAFCFAKGSEKFHIWFTNTSLYQKYVGPAFTGRRMEKSARTKAIVMLCIIFTVSFLIVPFWHAKAAIALVALLHIYYFTFKIKIVEQGE